MLTETTELRDKLESNTRYFRGKMTDAGFDIKRGDHPIVPIMLYDAVLAQKMAAQLLEEGIYVIGFFYPVVAKGQARIRVQLSAAHELHHLDKAIAAFTKIGKSLGGSPMKRVITICIAAVLISGCSFNNVDRADYLKPYFDSAGVQGCFALYDNARNEFTIYNKDRYLERFPAGGTFDIVVGLTSLETGKVFDEKSPGFKGAAGWTTYPPLSALGGPAHWIQA